MAMRGRGRPKQEKRDHPATPQTRAHHRAGYDIPVLDRMRDEGILSPSEHWAGLHLRRLHAVFSPHARMAAGFYWIPRPSGDPVPDAVLQAWRLEYEEARQRLTHLGLWRDTLDLVWEDRSKSGGCRISGGEGCRALDRLWRRATPAAGPNFISDTADFNEL